MPREVVTDARRLFRLAVLAGRARWRALLALAVAGLLAVLAAAPHDRAAAVWSRSIKGSTLHGAAGVMRHYGDFLDTLFYCGVMYGVGAKMGWRRWRVYALGAFLAACTAGSVANVVRVTTGRPRPLAVEGRCWVGPTLNSRMQSFPSGHTATTFAMSGTLAALYPPLGIPALIGSAGIAWGCIVHASHYPTDVATSVCIGLMIALVFADAVRRRLGESP